MLVHAEAIKLHVEKHEQLTEGWQSRAVDRGRKFGAAEQPLDNHHLQDNNKFIISQFPARCGLIAKETMAKRLRWVRALVCDRLSSLKDLLQAVASDNKNKNVYTF